MNQIELIKEAGRKAYIARKQHDEARCRFHTEWARKAARLEDNPQEALKSFNEAYKAESEGAGVAANRARVFLGIN